jgi:hypothetical protein
MIKRDSPAIQAVYHDFEVEVSSERRALLAEKGQRLYGKYCGTKGRGICAESFAEYHIWRGELVVARDFLAFLNQQAERIRQISPCTPELEQQSAMTERLIERIQSLLGT